MDLNTTRSDLSSSSRVKEADGETEETHEQRETKEEHRVTERRDKRKESSSKAASSRSSAATTTAQLRPCRSTPNNSCHISTTTVAHCYTKNQSVEGVVVGWRLSVHGKWMEVGSTRLVDVFGLGSCRTQVLISKDWFSQFWLSSPPMSSLDASSTA